MLFTDASVGQSPSGVTHFSLGFLPPSAAATATATGSPMTTSAAGLGRTNTKLADTPSVLIILLNL